LRHENRILRLHALFKRPVLRMVRAGGYGEGLWEGTFDARYTQPGDYLVQESGDVWFIAEQLPMQAPLCIRAIRKLSFIRPSSSATAGASGYGGIVVEGMAPLLSGWPAAIGAPDSKGQMELATTGTLPQTLWSVLLPPLTWLGLQPGDVMHDELGRSGVVELAECTSLGWRLGVRQAAS
jgi:hypothetical protein